MDILCSLILIDSIDNSNLANATSRKLPKMISLQLLLLLRWKEQEVMYPKRAAMMLTLKRKLKNLLSKRCSSRCRKSRQVR
jgi:hypothetical protein